MSTEKPHKKPILKYLPTVIMCLFLLALAVVAFSVFSNRDDPTKVTFFGFKPFIITSGSMENPVNRANGIKTHAIVWDKSVPFEEIQVGDVITLEREGEFITHRVIEIFSVSGTRCLQTRGDNSAQDDPFLVTQADYRFKLAAVWNFAAPIVEDIYDFGTNQIRIMGIVKWILLLIYFIAIAAVMLFIVKRIYGMLNPKYGERLTPLAEIKLVKFTKSLFAKKTANAAATEDPVIENTVSAEQDPAFPEEPKPISVLAPVLAEKPIPVTQQPAPVPKPLFNPPAGHPALATEGVGVLETFWDLGHILLQFVTAIHTAERHTLQTANCLHYNQTEEAVAPTAPPHTVATSVSLPSTPLSSALSPVLPAPTPIIQTVSAEEILSNVIAADRTKNPPPIYASTDAPGPLQTSPFHFENVPPINTAKPQEPLMNWETLEQHYGIRF